jgi:hypothetical protein
VHEGRWCSTYILPIQPAHACNPERLYYVYNDGNHLTNSTSMALMTWIAKVTIEECAILGQTWDVDSDLYLHCR